MKEERLLAFVKSFLKSNNFGILQLPKSGSARVNYIVTCGDKKYILTYNEKKSENESFFYLAKIFAGLGLPVPGILKINRERTLYLQDFMGDHTLFDLILKEGHSARIKELVRGSLELLSDFQNKTQGKIDFTKAYEYRRYNEYPIVHDLYYFKFFFADVLETDYQKEKLLKEFKRIAKEITSLSPQTLMIRDFQSRNLMVGSEQQLSLIDFQSSMEGPATYDLVSFLYQAKAHFPESWKKQFLAEYKDRHQQDYADGQFERNVDYCKLVRFLQVLGAYGFRGLVQKKEHFLRSIPDALDNILTFTHSWEEMKKYPELQKVVDALFANYEAYHLQ